MEGIEILNTYEHQIFQPAIVLLSTLISAVLGLVISYLLDRCFELSDSSIQAIMIIIGLFGVIIGAIITCYISEKETRYEVTIDDSVNYKEFTEKYKVVEVNGKIYTIVEKEVE